MFHLRFGLSDHLKALLDFVFGSRRRVKKVRIFRAWFSHFQLFAEVFRPLPFIGNLFKIVPDSGYQLSQASVMSKGLDIFRWLFPSSSSGTDTTQALTDDMPLASMISACVDVEASFADSMALSRPQICPDPPDVALFVKVMF